MKRAGEAKLSQMFGLGGSLPVRLHLRSDLHLLRKSWHMVMGLMIAFIYLYSGITVTGAVLLTATALGIDLFVETARLRIPAFNESILRYWGPFMRSNEINRMSGVPYYLAATLLTIAIFPKPVAILSILYLACGDPIASLFGILYGKRSMRLAQGKSLIGTMAGVAACMVVGYVFLKSLGLSDATVLPVAILGGLAGGTAELMPFDWDDNFTIPVISGFFLWLLFILFGA
jgi:diacylglycerol kinase (CTP)